MYNSIQNSSFIFIVYFPLPFNPHKCPTSKKQHTVVHANDSFTKSTLNKGYSKRKRQTLHNDKGNSPTRGYNPCKYLYTQHRGTKIGIAKHDGHKGETDSNSHSRGF